jgi:uncharacterized membrane protein YbhN (UPF0104 family)
MVCALLSRDARQFVHPCPGTRLIDARVTRTASVALRLGLLALAVWALRHQLSGVQLGELLLQFGGYGWRHAALALAGTVASFVILGLVESLALSYTDTAPVPARSVMTTAFLANAFSQSIGLALLTGSAVRMRMYARRGVDAAAVARISAFVTVTITLGLLACGAAALLASRAPLAIAHIVLPVRALGLGLALVVLGYVIWAAGGRGDRGDGGRWPVQRPGVRVALAQLALSAADWVVTATVLYALLPPAAGLDYASLVRVYLVAQTVGMASHVPGGAGVFEAVVLTLAATGVATQRTSLIAALVMFRAVYYLLPFVVAVVVGGLSEVLPHHRRATRARQTIPRKAPTTAGAENEVARVH